MSNTNYDNTDNGWSGLEYWFAIFEGMVRKDSGNEYLNYDEQKEIFELLKELKDWRELNNG